MEKLVLDRKTQKQSYKGIIPHVIILAFSILFLVVLVALRNSVEISEKITKTVTKGINAWSAGISDNVSYSVFEAFVVSAVILAVIWVILIIVQLCTERKITAIKSICILVTVVFLFGSYYMFTAGFAYNRKPMELFGESSIGYYEFYDIVKYYKEDYDYLAEKLERNENGEVICPYSFEELSELLREESKRLPDYFNDVPFSSKPMKIFSSAMSDFRITGVTFTPSGDCGLNILQPQTSITATMAHEIMHSLGVMRENDANASALYLLISSDNEYLRYAGYYDYYGYLLQALALNYNEEEYDAVLTPRLASLEHKFENEYWSSQKSFTDKIGDFFNSLYLKLSGIQNGSGSYHEPSSRGDDSYTEGDRVFVEVKYNSFQRCFIQVYNENNQ